MHWAIGWVVLMLESKSAHQRQVVVDQIPSIPKRESEGKNLEFLDLLINLKNFHLLQKQKPSSS